MTDPQNLDDELAHVPLLSSLSRRQRGKLLAGSRVVEHPAGREVTAEGAGAVALHVVLDGAADVSIRGRAVRTLGPGEYFGEISMIDGKPRSATVTAGENLRTLYVPHAAFTGLVDNDAAVAKELLVALCGRIRQIESEAISD